MPKGKHNHVHLKWETFYRTKRGQQNRGQRCPGNCGNKPTESHHLWARRPDSPELQNPINIIQACHACHMKEGLEFQIRAALMKLWEYSPREVEAYVESLPGKIKRTLPSHYFAALELYQLGKRPFVDY